MCALTNEWKSKERKRRKEGETKETRRRREGGEKEERRLDPSTWFKRLRFCEVGLHPH